MSLPGSAGGVPPSPGAASPASPATTGSVWRALEDLTRKHDAAVARALDPVAEGLEHGKSTPFTIRLILKKLLLFH
jgi:hypothetical protein